MIDLNNYSLLTIFLVGLVVILAASEIGRRLGLSAGDRTSGNINTLEGAILGLLALMIGFTFAMSLARFEARRDAVLNEANTIGTTALRARLLPQPHKAEVLKLLREYVKIRLDITQRPVSRSELMSAIDRSNTLQEALWQQAIAVSTNDNAMVPVGLFIQTLNDMIDNQEKRLTALFNRVPNIVILALFGVAVIASAFAGYASGLEARRTAGLPVYIMGILVAVVILLIMDLDRPSAGFISVSQQPMIDTAASIAAIPD
jgi:CDP-diglyceride synthetase